MILFLNRPVYLTAIDLDAARRIDRDAHIVAPNLLHVMNRQTQDERTVNEAFFFNQLLKDNRVNAYDRHNSFLVNDRYLFRVSYPEARWKVSPDFYYAVDEVEPPLDEPNCIPLWMFGFLY